VSVPTALTRCDVLVAGLGVMGSAVAHHAARRGLRVIGLDRFHPPHDRGSSHGETRNIRQAIYESPGYVPLLQRAFDLWEELERESGRSLLRITGRMMMGSPEGRAIAGAIATARQFDLPIEVVDAAEVTRRFPAFAPSADMVGVYEARAGMLFAEPCVEAQLAQARRFGADFRFDEPLLSWRAGPGGVEVTTSQSRYAADKLVLATGAWLPALLPSLPLSVERQVLLWFAPRDHAERFGPDRCPIYLWEIGPDFTLYGVPFWGDGIKVARHHGGEATTVDTVRRDVDDRDIAPIRAALERHMPSAAGRFVRARTCVYTNTPDLHFIIDRHPEHPAVLVVSPCSGHGFKYAAAIGEAVAQLAADEVPRVDLSPFRLDRFR
jgi:sarcosine oxidase